jgi:hypothetical protein
VYMPRPIMFGSPGWGVSNETVKYDLSSVDRFPYILDGSEHAD